MADGHHHHGCGGHDHHGPCDHTTSEDLGIKYSLFEKIDRDNLECLNESVDGAGAAVFKPWDERNNGKFVVSDVDEELLFNIPFTGCVKIKGIIVMGPDEESHPGKIRLFKSKQKMTFENCHAAADQEFELAKDPKGAIQYPLKLTKFSDVTHLTIHVPQNYGAEATRIDYIGLSGEWRPAHRHGVTICNYEIAPSFADHPEVGSWNTAGGHHVS